MSRSTTDPDAEWSALLKRAEELGFIAQAYGGVSVLATHAAQREHGIYCRVQAACGHGPHPQIDKPGAPGFCPCLARGSGPCPASAQPTKEDEG